MNLFWSETILILPYRKADLTKPTYKIWVVAVVRLVRTDSLVDARTMVLVALMAVIN
jgi:hypothetical protein